MYGAWVHDTTTGITVPIGELDPRVVSPPEVSENGDIVAVGGSIGVLVFETESGEVTEPLPDVYPERVLPGAFGHRIYHFSRGSALPPDGEDDLWPLLFHDLRTGDVGTAIEAAPNGPMSISSDGRMMTIEHRMREALVWDTSDGTSQELRAPAAGTIGAVRLSGDGRHAVYSTQSANVVPDENGAPDVFVMQVLE